MRGTGECCTRGQVVATRARIPRLIDRKEGEGKRARPRMKYIRGREKEGKEGKERGRKTGWRVTEGRERLERGEPITVKIEIERGERKDARL